MAKTTYTDLTEIMTDLKKEWGEAGEHVVENAFAEHNKISMNDYLNYCTACGGNWGGRLLSGMKILYPKTYEAIPEYMGVSAFSLICNTLTLCGVYAND